VTHPCGKCGYIADAEELTYVNITSNLPECKGWLNLLLGEHYCIALVDNVYIADQIRQIIKEHPKYRTVDGKVQERKPCPLCGGSASVERGYDTNCINPDCLLYGINYSLDRWNTRPEEHND
jgi:ribosomal protein S27AE